MDDGSGYTDDSGSQDTEASYTDDSGGGWGGIDPSSAADSMAGGLGEAVHSYYDAAGHVAHGAGDAYLGWGHALVAAGDAYMGDMDGAEQKNAAANEALDD